MNELDPTPRESQAPEKAAQESPSPGPKRATHVPTGAPPVKLEVYEGPLDLLLDLIRKQQINIYDIPIAAITKQYLDYLHMLEELNIDVAAEFVFMAATLIYIKSKTETAKPGSSSASENSPIPGCDHIASSSIRFDWSIWAALLNCSCSRSRCTNSIRGSSCSSVEAVGSGGRSIFDLM